MTIEEIKNQVGERARDIISNGLHLEKKGNNYRCPNGSGHSNGDKNSSMSWHKEANQFHCFTCGIKIDIYEYYKTYEKRSHSEIMEMFSSGDTSSINTKLKPNFATGTITPDQITYLNKQRGLSLKTIEHFKLGNDNGNISIPYYNQGNVVGVKVKNLKNSKPKYLSITGSEFGLFNRDNLIQEEALMITEGEFDCMALMEVGYKNVSSIGTGGSSVDKLLSTERDYLKGFKALIILGDNDEVGQSMKKRFIKEFGFLVKLPNKENFMGCKDVNEVLLKHGKAQVRKIIESAEVKIEGLRNLDTKPYEGIEAINGKYIPTGLPSIDYAINDLGPGLVTLLTGRSNGGKSTLVNQIIANAINLDKKVLLVAGEGLIEILINNIYKAVIGKDDRNFDTKKINKRFFKEPKPEVLKALQRWHKGKLTIFSKGESILKTTDELFSLISLEVKMSRPDLVVIDNLMSVLSVEKVNEKFERQADFIQRCNDMAKSERIHIVIVLHPNKLVSKNTSMDFENISGSSDIYNKADNIIAVKRNYDEDRESDGEIEVLKNRYFSDLPKINTQYDSETGMILELERLSGNVISYGFRWRQYLESGIEEDEVIEGRDYFMGNDDNAYNPFA